MAGSRLSQGDDLPDTELEGEGEADVQQVQRAVGPADHRSAEMIREHVVAEDRNATEQGE